MSASRNKYTPEMADAICAKLADGTSLRKVCEMPGMPCKVTVFKWIRENPEFLVLYDRAKTESADSHADDITDIADDGRNDWMANNDPDNPGYRANGEYVQRSRLRVDARKWLASKLKPKKYGERIQHANDPDNPLIKELTEADKMDAAKRIALLLLKADEQTPE